MNNYYAITVLGKDRPGIVAEVTGVLFRAGGNLHDSSNIIVGSEFAMILLVSVPAKVSGKILETELTRNLGKTKLQVAVREISAQDIQSKTVTGKKFTLTVYGIDQAGIVHAFAKLLAKHKINVIDLQTRRGGGPRPLYLMLFEIAVPRGCSVAKLKAALNQLSAKLSVDCALNVLDSNTL